MPFELDKKNAMEKIHSLDNSRAGKIDGEIRELVSYINSLPDFYTTSSCSGRIMVIGKDESTRKNQVKWLLASHSPVELSDVLECLQELPEEDVWLRMEAPIIHICARDIYRAIELLKLANQAGFRRAGIISLGKRIIVEIFSTERLDVPIASDSKLLIPTEYLGHIVNTANNKLKNSRKKLKKIYLLLKKHCK